LLEYFGQREHSVSDNRATSTEKLSHPFRRSEPSSINNTKIIQRYSLFLGAIAPTSGLIRGYNREKDSCFLGNSLGLKAIISSIAQFDETEAGSAGEQPVRDSRTQSEWRAVIN
jgi:hypothetical protein